MELVEPKRRDIVNTIICFIYTLGQVILGVTAWFSPSWRTMLRILYIPGFIFSIFFWSVPKSRSWLLSTSKKENIQETVSQKKRMLNETERNVMGSNPVEKTVTQSFRDALSQRVLLLRMIHCSFTWLCSNFVYYGLMMNSVAISENIYIDFIFGVIVEIPGYLIYYYGKERFQRRWSLLIAFLLTGAFCIGVGFINEEFYWLRLIIFLMGKCGSTIVFTLLYVYTTELFPTKSRNAMFSICSMFGRIGSMMAPQIPLLARIWRSLPSISFGVIALTAGSLALFFPETFNAKLPETIEDAVNVGQSTIEEVKNARNSNYNSNEMMQNTGLIPKTDITIEVI